MAIPVSNHSGTIVSSDGPKKNYLLPFALVTSLFFFWGFIHNLDPLLMAHLRRAFSLSTLQASLVDSAVYVAYFLMAIPAGIIMKKYGYKTGILIGLSLFATGCYLFVPAANTMMYAFFLGALFILASGLAILETAANPYATVLGNPATAEQRLNLAQSFNGLAAILGPWVGREYILSDEPKSDEALKAMSATAKAAYLQAETATVKLPYIILGSLILLVAAMFFFTKLPDIKEEGDEASSGFLAALKNKQVSSAVIAQFFYVSAQTCVLSFLILFATKATSIAEKDAAIYSIAAGLAFMIGRFVGTTLMRFIAPTKLLAIYSVCCMALSLVTIFGNGIVTLYAIVGIAFFMSIMFPTIFALGIKDLGAATKPASSLIVMSIVGGAILPPVFGIISDKTGNIQYGYFVVLVSFAVILLFAVTSHKVISKKAVEEVPFAFD